LAHEIDSTLQWVPRHNIASLRDAVPHRHVFYKHSVPTGRWAYDQVSVILRFHPQRCSTQIKNPKSTINNRKSIPVPAGPNVCSKKGEGDNPSRRDGMFILTWHMRLTGHYIRYPDITLRPYRTLGLRSSVGDPSVSPQTVFNPNQKSQIDNR